MNTEKILAVFQEKFGKDFSSYVQFCESRETNIKDEYCEVHHILPRSVFPEYAKSEWNLVLLAYDDHVEAHIQLAAIHPIRLFTRPLNFMSDKTEPRTAGAYRAIWSEFKKTPAYDSWLEKRKAYCSRVFKVGGDRYSQILMMAEKNRGRVPARGSSATKEWWTDERRSEQSRKLKSASSPERSAAYSERSKEVWARDDGTRRLAIKARNQTPEMRKKNSEGGKKSWQNPSRVQKHKEATTGILWWTNGTEDKKSRISPGEGWIRGRNKTLMNQIVRKREANYASQRKNGG